MSIIIDQEFKNLIPPLRQDERNGLEESILREGCREPLVLWGETLVDGHNRFDICQQHGISYQTKQINFTDKSEAKAWIIKNQFSRRNLPPYERARLALQLKPALSEKAKENQCGGQGGVLLQNFVKANTQRELARIAGVSHDTIAKVEKIEALASDVLKQQLRSGDLSIHQAYQSVRRTEKEAEREAHRQENAAKVETLATPLEAQGLFQTIVIDPPWDWNDEGDSDQMGRARPDYHTMPIEEIEKLPISKIADENCHLYLWVTNRSLPKAFRLIETWGFRYITCLTWVKPSFGMGNYFRGSTEQVLFCVKGQLPLKRHDVGTHFEAPRGEGHSAKPDLFYQLVEKCSHGPFIDVFGRQDRAGWSVWGENG